MQQFHTLAPIYDENSRVLILGSFPSVKSREAAFYYGNPQNRFWAVIAAVFGADVPQTAEEKTRLLLQNGVALWDVIRTCEITGSDDASIKNAQANDLSPILQCGNITRIFANGGTAARLYKKLLLTQTGIPAQTLPSTSPANARFSLRDLIDKWQVLTHD
jgi:hypoxanthine-DNA glycosylase